MLNTLCRSQNLLTIKLDVLAIHHEQLQQLTVNFASMKSRPTQFEVRNQSDCLDALTSRVSQDHQIAVFALAYFKSSAANRLNFPHLKLHTVAALVR